MTQVLIFGDSIVQGFWDLEGGGWAQRLKNYLDKKSYGSEKHFFCTFNLGIAGDTSEGLLKRFEFETLQRYFAREVCVIFIAIGTNDAGFISEKNQFIVDPKRYEQNIEKIIKTAKKYSKSIFFVGLTPVNEEKTIPVDWIDITYQNKNISNYELLAKKVCKKNKIPFIEVYDKLVADSKKWADGCHPESKSHKKIFEIVKKELEKQKII